MSVNTRPLPNEEDPEVTGAKAKIAFYVILALVTAVLAVSLSYKNRVVELNNSMPTVVEKPYYHRTHVGSGVIAPTPNTVISAWNSAHTKCATLQGGMVVITGKSEKVKLVTPKATRLLWQPKGDQLAVLSSDPIMVSFIAGKTSSVPTYLGSSLGSTSWSPDGTQLSVVDSSRGTITFIGSATHKSLATIKFTGMLSASSWNHTGDRLALASSSLQSGAVVVIDGRTYMATPQVSFNSAVPKSLSWSPDGESVRVATGNIGNNLPTGSTLIDSHGKVLP